MVNIIVGLEIHAQLNTKSKIFCGCENNYNDDPNQNVCPLCLGMPGALPSLNEEAVNYAIMAGHAFSCHINTNSSFDRKKYFYPDLSKGYQITQDRTPICENGYIELDSGKKINLERIHLEEDTGRTIHHDDGTTLLDYNRAGIPLIEIVTLPDIEAASEAREFLNKLKNTLNYIGISDGKMEEGSLRCDVNINIEDPKTGDRTNIIEIKNLNSFSAVEKAIEYEAKRQVEFLNSDKKEARATRRWDDSINETVLMREKFQADDYKYTKDVQVPDLVVSQERIDKVKEEMPELIEEKTSRFMSDYGLEEYETQVLTSSRVLSEYFESLSKLTDNYQLLSNFIINDLLRRIEVEEFDPENLKFSMEDLINLLDLIESEKINNNTAKKVFRLMFEEGIEPISYIEENKLIQITDDSFIDDLVEEVLEENPSTIEEYLSGKDRVLGFLVGQVMKKSQGKANPQMANEKLVEAINSRK